MLTQSNTVLTDPLNSYTIKISSDDKKYLTQSYGNYNYRDRIYKKAENKSYKEEKKTHKNYNKLCFTNGEKKSGITIQNPYFSKCYVTEYYSSFDSTTDPKLRYNTKLSVFDSMKKNLNDDFELETRSNNKLEPCSNNKIKLDKKPRSNSLEFSSQPKNKYNFRRRRSGSTGEMMSDLSNNGMSNGDKFFKHYKVKKIFPYVEDGRNLDNSTQKPANGKGASCLLWSHRIVFTESGSKKVLCVLLGHEKSNDEYKRKYAGKFNLFGGGFEREKGDYSLHDTVERELSEEFGPIILNKVRWNGSPWAYNQTYIEFGSVSPNFIVEEAFRENDEIKEAKWFPVENILKTRRDQDTKSYMVKDIDGIEREISLYAHGVIKATNFNGHIR